MILLKELADVQTGPFGSQLHQEDYVEIGTPMVTVEHLGNRKFTEQNLPMVSDKDKERLLKYVLQKGDIVFSRVGSVDRCSYVDEKHSGWMFSGRCLRVRPNERVNSEYLYYFFTTERTKQLIRSIAVGATMPSINTKILSEVEVPLPEIEIQEKIASVLSAIDNKIENNEAINANLLEQAKAIYKQMILDLPEEELQDAVLSDIAVITMGQSPSGESYNEDGNGEVFYQGRAEFGERFPTRRLFTTEPKRMAETNDVLMSVRAPVGDLNVAYEKCCIGRGLGAIRSKDGKQSFVLYTMFALQEALDVYNGEGTVFGSINRDALNKMEIKLPSADIIDEFEQTVSKIDFMIRRNYEEICNLTKLRDFMLSKLMSGELDLSGLET